MSRLAQAGDSSTVSPGRAAALAAATAARMSAARSVGHTAVECRGERGRVAADQHDVAHLAGERGPQPGEVLVLAVAARNQHQRARKALDRGDRGTDVGALGVVDVAHAGHVRDPLRAMRQPAERGQRLEHRAARQPERLAHRERGQRVGRVVLALKLHGRQRQQRLAAAGKQRLRVARQAVVGGGVAHAETEHALAGARHGPHAGVVGVDHRRPAAVEDARLGGGIVLEGVVAVEVVGRDVEHARHRRVQRVGGLELVARQLEHVEVGHRAFEQVEGRFAEVAARNRAAARRVRELGQQRRDRALAVGAGDRGDRRLRLTGEQLDVPDHRQAAAGGRDRDRLAQRQSRRDHHLRDAVEQGFTESAGVQFGVRHLLAQRRRTRRLGTRVRHAHREPLAAQVARAGQPGAAEPEHQRAAAGFERGEVALGVVHRSFSVARPTSTRITVMIQKRTITFGSAQPLSSKW